MPRPTPNTRYGLSKTKPNLTELLASAAERTKLDFLVSEIERLSGIVAERDNMIDLMYQTVSTIALSAAEAESYILEVTGVRLTRERIRCMRNRGEVTAFGTGRKTKYPVIELLAIAKQLQKQGGKNADI